MVNELPELEDPASLVSRTFALLDENRSDEARILWLEESDLYENFQMPPLRAFNMFGESIMFVSKSFDLSGNHTRIRQHNWIHPLEKTTTLEWTQQVECLREGGCRVLNKDDTHWRETIQMQIL